MCIRRDDMPQVDLYDLPNLLTFLSSRYDIHGATRILPVRWLKHYQCMSDTRPATNPALLKKPLLISLDLGIVDGNGRAMQREVLGIKDAECIQFDRGFEEVRRAIHSYPLAYRYGDGPQPYRI